MSHFRVPPPVFIGARQPYAPRLGIPQSGPTPQPPPLIGPMAAASFSLIVAAWQPYAPAQPQTRIAPLIPAAAAPSQPPVQTRTNAAIVQDSWNVQFAVPQGFARIAPLLPVAATVQQAFDGRANAAIILDAWAARHGYPPAAARIAPLISSLVTPDAPPLKSLNLLPAILASWVPQPTLISLASFAGQISADPPPVTTSVNLTTVISAWRPPFSWVQGCRLAPLIPAAIVPDQPPVPGRQTQGLVTLSWQPPHFISQGYCEIAPTLPIAVAPDSPPIAGRQTLQLVMNSWESRTQRQQPGAGIAPLLSPPPVAGSPPRGFPQTLRVIVDSWTGPSFVISLRGLAADYTQPVVYVSNQRRLVRAKASNRVVIARPRLK